MSAEQRERLRELLSDRATQPLSPGEFAELLGLLDAFPDEDSSAFDRAAAAVDLVLGADEAPEPMPAELRAQVERQAASLVNPGAAARGGGRSAAPRRPSRRPALQALPWAVAVACLALALTVFLQSELTPAPPPAEPRWRQVAEAPDRVELAWSPGGDPTGSAAAGEVVWSDGLQAGFMRFRGMAPNDPSEQQYQLWVFDAERDERYPVDGGVFDVGPDGETVVPIRAVLPVSRAVLFAITVEEPGGVVVSSRERLALLAQVPASDG